MSKVRLEYSGDGTCAAGIRMYVDGERVYRIAEINNDMVKQDGDATYMEFEADVELMSSENGNKIAFLKNIRS